jgi:hypothetical protein
MCGRGLGDTIGIYRRFSPDLQGEVTYNDSKVAGRAVKRRRIERSDIRSWIDRHSYPPLQEETSRTKNLIIEFKVIAIESDHQPIVFLGEFGY